MSANTCSLVYSYLMLQARSHWCTSFVAVYKFPDLTDFEMGNVKGLSWSLEHGGTFRFETHEIIRSGFLRGLGI